MHYKVIRHILIFVSFSGFISESACRNIDQKKSSDKIVNQQSGESKEDSVKRNIPTDSIRFVEGRISILAYSLSQLEYNSLSGKEKGEYDEGYSDFSSSLEEFGKIASDSVLLQETASRFIIIGDSIIDRESLKKYNYGLIFISKDGKKRIFEGGLSVAEIESQIRDFLYNKQ
jgi:hypothetical protein